LIAFRGDLPEATRLAVEQALLALHQDEAGLAALTHAAGITRFERLTPAQRRAVLDWAPVLLPPRR
jgi:ABC-type phosphate/phosphonate transport system substrate-binding protein